MKLVSIPQDQYDNYRLDAIFKGYKWDPQFLDNNTVARHVLLITPAEHAQLEQMTEALTRETVQSEELLNHNPQLAKPLALPRQIRRELASMKNYDPARHIRLTRYDFHPTTDGKWALSEVNSDVPGGFAEASLLPQIAMDLFKGKPLWHKNFGDILASAIAQKTKPGGTVMLVHCTCYSDDRQVMQFLGDKLAGLGFRPLYAAADHLRFEKGGAVSLLDGNTGPVDAIVRFTPLEWLVQMKPKRWQGYFNTVTPSCNHPIAIFAQTKRFPLVWDALEQRGVSLAAWRSLLPETREVKAARGKEGFIYKPACGRVGEGISIKEACREDEYKQILRDVKRHPKEYLAQKRFDSKPLHSEEGDFFHVCLGCYSVEGRAAGYYARISRTPRIDSNAADIPVLIEGARNDGPGHSAARAPQQAAAQDYRIAAYKKWAPAGARWVDWARPVPFVAMRDPGGPGETSSFAIPPIEYIDKARQDTAIIVDTPGGSAVQEGVALAHLGFRPIPLYNGTNEQENALPLVETHTMELALRRGARALAEISLPQNAPPAFLLDSNRTHRHRMDPSVFDNSWDIYDQDMPSADTLLAGGIHRVIVRGERIQMDLARILYKYQKKGIGILFTDGYQPPKARKLRRPPRKES